MVYSLRHKKLQPNFLELPEQFDLIVPFLHFYEQLEKELEYKNIQVLFSCSQFILCTPLSENLIWAQDWWPKTQLFSDTNKAIDYMKGLPYLGAYHHAEESNLSKKLKSILKRVPLKRIEFKVPHPFNFKFYTYTTYKEFIFVCPTPYQRFPLGWHEFNENKLSPPNRAYLKLWEVFAIHQVIPDQNSKAIEVGASPGGWTWVLEKFCKEIHTFDRAPLDQKLQNLKSIHHHIGDAFQIPPEKYKNFDWFFSDLICTPEKIHETILFWLNKSNISNFVCTIKFKGSCQFEILDQLLLIPDSKIVHLYQNKNEVTWIKKTVK